MTIFLSKAFAALMTLWAQQSPQQHFEPPVPRSDLERLVLSANADRNIRVGEWLKAHASDLPLVRRELGAIGFKSVLPIKRECEAYAYDRVVSADGEALRARIELCPDGLPSVLLLRGFFSSTRAPDPNAPVMSIPNPAPLAPPAPPAPPK